MLASDNDYFRFGSSEAVCARGSLGLDDAVLEKALREHVRFLWSFPK